MTPRTPFALHGSQDWNGETIFIVIEETGSGYAPYSPDLPGCVSATGPRHELEKMKEAVAFHLAGRRASDSGGAYVFDVHRPAGGEVLSSQFSVISFKSHRPASLGLAKDCNSWSKFSEESAVGVERRS
jgi:predicted RNase H-like HicB family nuclease